MVTTQFTRTWCAAAAVTLSLFAANGCDRAANNVNKPKTIAVIPKGLTHIFWMSVKAGAEKACNEEGVTLKWDGPPKESDVNTQIRIIGDVRTFGVDALVVAPLSEGAISATLADAKKKMPVVVFDSGSTFKDYDAFVATDNFKGGQLAGREMIRLIGDRKDVELAMVRYGPESQSTMKREEGFLSEIRKNPAVKVYDNKFAGDDVSKAQTLLTDMLSNPKINAVFASNESTTQGSLGALAQAKLLGKVMFIGFDTNAALVDAMEKGQTQALVLQDPVKMGYLAVKAAVAAVKGQKVEKEQPIEPTLATPANMKQAAIEQLLRPAL
jgi:ribose transport system substrate-binding protein